MGLEPLWTMTTFGNCIARLAACLMMTIMMMSKMHCIVVIVVMCMKIMTVALMRRTLAISNTRLHSCPDFQVERM